MSSAESGAARVRDVRRVLARRSPSPRLDGAGLLASTEVGSEDRTCRCIVLKLPKLGSGSRHDNSIANRLMPTWVRSFGRHIAGSSLLTRIVETAALAVITGTIASVVTTGALAGLAVLEGRGVSQPTNSTSHWLYGEEAGRVEDVDTAHTLVGYTTHHLSAIFWALPFEAWLARRPRRTPLALLRDAGVMSAIAAVVDYGLVPRRLTPGWESVLSKRSIVAAYAALAVGLALGTTVAQRLR
jgi:hypothetical protein